MKKLIRLTEGDLHRIIKNTVNRVIKENIRKRRINEDLDDDSLYDPEDDNYEDGEDFREFTPNRSMSYNHQRGTEDNFMGGVEPDDDEFDEYGNNYDEGDDEEPWSPYQLDDYDDYEEDPSKYNNALQKQKISNADADRYFRSRGINAKLSPSYYVDHFNAMYNPESFE